MHRIFSKRQSEEQRFPTRPRSHVPVALTTLAKFGLMVAGAPSTFCYEPLPSQASIRLLDLLPPSKDGTIMCRLRTADLDDDPRPLFTALSYEWTDPFPGGYMPTDARLINMSDMGECRQIFLNGASFGVRMNLWKFLDAVSHSSLAVNGIITSLWVDAICINQADLREKNHQVQFMKTIYSRADRVIAWLGSANPLEFNTLVRRQSEMASWVRAQPEVLDSMPLGLEKLRRNDWYIVQSFALSHWGRDNIAGERWTFDEGQSLLWLDSRSYWSRLWVVQETILARRLLIMFGSRFISWKVIQSAPTWVLNTCGASGSLRPVYNWRLEGLDVSRDMNKLIDDFLRCECQDFRDKIFGLLGLANNGESFLMDYTDSGKVVILKALQHFQTGEDSAFLNSLLKILNLRKQYNFWPAQGASTEATSRIVCKTPVRMSLRRQLRLDVQVWDLKQSRGEIRVCCCSSCRCSPERSLHIFFDVPSTATIYVCVPIPERSSLGFLFLTARGLKMPICLAAVEIVRDHSPESGNGSDRCATLLIHHLPAIGLPLIRTSGYITALGSYLEASPELCDTMIFGYPRLPESSNSGMSLHITRASSPAGIQNQGLAVRTTLGQSESEVVSAALMPDNPVAENGLAKWINPIVQGYLYGRSKDVVLLGKAQRAATDRAPA